MDHHPPRTFWNLKMGLSLTRSRLAGLTTIRHGGSFGTRSLVTRSLHHLDSSLGSSVFVPTQILPQSSAPYCNASPETKTWPSHQTTPFSGSGFEVASALRRRVVHANLRLLPREESGADPQTRAQVEP